LLDVTRVLRGKLQIKRRPLELGELMRRTVEDHRLLTANAGLELDVRLPPRPLWVDGDPARLAQALGNVLANAVKFHQPGRTHLRRPGRVRRAFWHGGSPGARRWSGHQL
jgi:two-component system CheB/CheR fusion protein